MGCFAPSAEGTYRDYALETATNVRSQIALAPEVLAAEREFQPQYLENSLNNLNLLLSGRPGGTRTVTESTPTQAGWYDASGNLVSTAPMTATATGGAVGGANGRGGFAGPAFTGNFGGATANAMTGLTYRPAGSTTTSREVQDSAVPGLLELAQMANRSQRAADVADVAALGPEARAALRASNPENARLLDLLNAQAEEGLLAGTGLTPAEQRQIQQASRAAMSARGLAGSNLGLGDELLRQYDVGQQLLRQRQQFAGNVLGYNQNLMGDPFMQILARPGTGLNQAQSVFGQSGPSLFNPESPYAGGIANSNAGYAAAFADPSTVDKVNAVGGIVGNLIGSIAGAAI